VTISVGDPALEPDLHVFDQDPLVRGMDLD
jgi:hypothetical protein